MADRHVNSNSSTVVYELYKYMYVDTSRKRKTGNEQWPSVIQQFLRRPYILNVYDLKHL